MAIVNEVRLNVWKRSSRPLTGETARIDADGSLVPTTGECKQGMDLSQKGIWGYHPLLISLANAGEPLFILNRSGNRPSFEGAPAALDQAVALCRRAGFADIPLRGDTDFSMTAHLDHWDEAGVRFVFGHEPTRHSSTAPRMSIQAIHRALSQGRGAIRKQACQADSLQGRNCPRAWLPQQAARCRRHRRI
jgi:hypothetical protein